MNLVNNKDKFLKDILKNNINQFLIKSLSTKIIWLLNNNLFLKLK